MVTGSIQYDEMGLIPPGLQNGNRFGADFHRLAAAIDMVIIIGRFEKWTGQQRIMALPGAGSIGWEDGAPAWISACAAGGTARSAEQGQPIAHLSKRHNQFRLS